MAPEARLRWLGLPPRIALGFAAAILTLAVAALASYAALSARASASRHVRHTAAAQLAVEELESALVGAHTAMEAYLAGGDRHHHEQFLVGRRKVRPALETLLRLSELHEEQRRRVDALSTHVEVVLADHDRVEALVQAGDVAGARAVLASRPAAEAFERADAALDDLEEDEARAHEGREAAWSRSVFVLNAVFLTAVGVLLVLVLAGARLVRDEMRRREAQAAEREQALFVQQRLMAVVSHDLRNPLNVILAGGWALSRGDRTAESTRLACRIVGAGQRMARLIRDVLDWSCVHGGAPIPVCPREADLHEVCRRIAEEQCDRDGDRIHVEREGDTCGVFDPDRMEQVVGNLVSNALRHAPAGTPVRVRAIGTEDELLLEVRDQGPGVPPEALARIFEPFRSGAGGSGVGLGLFIARALAEAHGGAIHLHSKPGDTTFVVRLPRDSSKTWALRGAPPDAAVTPPAGFVRGVASNVTEA